MLEVFYTPSFIRQFKLLGGDLQEEIVDKIGLFKDEKNHKQLRVHKLKGRLKDRYSFSVNYKTRVVFNYLSKKEVILLVIGDHDVYKN